MYISELEMSLEKKILSQRSEMRSWQEKLEQEEIKYN